MNNDETSVAAQTELAEEMDPGDLDGESVAAQRHDAESLSARFSLRLDKPVRLSVTDNINAMMSFRNDRDGGLRLRLHHMFLSAPDPVLEELAAWMANPRSSCPLSRSYMRQNRHLVRAGKECEERSTILRPKGRIYNLHAIFARLNAEYFDSKLEMRITWGKRGLRERVRSVRLGCYCPRNKVITISRRLDKEEIPPYFVDYVVYHDMLHAALGIQEDENGRRRIHTPEFHRLERLFADHEKALAFERKYFGEPRKTSFFASLLRRGF